MTRDKLHIVVFGAHIGDAEITTGGVIAKYTREAHNATIVHLTRGEKGHPVLPPEEYEKQKTKEAEESAKILKADVRFLPYRDAELPVNNEVKLIICDAIRELKPDIIVTHWKGSFHRDHVNTYHNVTDGIFYAGLPAIKRKLPAHHVKGLYFAENWEDPIDFKPEIYIDISETFGVWVDAISKHEFIREETSGFPYMDYYKALARVRGAESGFKYAEAFMIPEWWGARRCRLQFFP